MQQHCNFMEMQTQSQVQHAHISIAFEWNGGELDAMATFSMIYLSDMKQSEVGTGEGVWRWPHQIEHL